MFWGMLKRERIYAANGWILLLSYSLWVIDDGGDALLLLLPIVETPSLSIESFLFFLHWYVFFRQKMDEWISNDIIIPNQSKLFHKLKPGTETVTRKVVPETWLVLLCVSVWDTLSPTSHCIQSGCLKSDIIRRRRRKGCDKQLVWSSSVFIIIIIISRRKACDRHATCLILFCLHNHNHNHNPNY